MAVERRKSPLMIVLGLLLSALCVFFTQHAFSERFRQAYAARHYVPIPASVVNARVIRSKSDSTDHGQQRYAPDIQFSYRVDGKDYRSDTYAYLPVAIPDPGPVQRLVDRFPAHAVIQAYIDPDQPEHAILDISDPPMEIPMGAMPYLLSGVFGMILLIHGLRGVPRRRGKGWGREKK